MKITISSKQNKKQKYVCHKSKLLKTKPVSNYCVCFERVSENSLSRYGTTNLYDFSKNKIWFAVPLFFQQFIFRGGEIN